MTASSAQASKVRPSSSIDALSAPPIRAALPPARTIAPSASGGWLMPQCPRGGVTGLAWQAGGMAEDLRVALVQRASSLDPPRIARALAELDVEADLTVLPEAFARDFGSPGDDISAYAEPLDGPFAKAVADLAGSTGTVVAGMFESAPDPDRPFNTLVVRGRAEAAYRKIHLYDSFGYRESDRLTAGPWQPTVVQVNGFGIGLMTCYDLRFPELARALVDAGADVLVVPAAWVPGARPRTSTPARSTTGARWSGPAPSRTRRTSSRSARRPPATPVTRWSRPARRAPGRRRPRAGRAHGGPHASGPRPSPGRPTPRLPTAGTAPDNLSACPPPHPRQARRPATAVSSGREAGGARPRGGHPGADEAAAKRPAPDGPRPSPAARPASAAPAAPDAEWRRPPRRRRRWRTSTPASASWSRPAPSPAPTPPGRSRPASPPALAVRRRARRRLSASPPWSAPILEIGPSGSTRPRRSCCPPTLTFALAARTGGRPFVFGGWRWLSASPPW